MTDSKTGPIAPLSRQSASATAQEVWENEGGRLRFGAGRVVYSPGDVAPFQAQVTRPRGEPLYQSFATMHEAEAFIRRNTPAPPPGLSTLYDRPAGSNA